MVAESAGAGKMDPRAVADRFVENLRGAIGDSLRSAALFGSAARGEWVRGFSDVNVLVLVDDISAGLLSSAAPTAQRAADEGVSPLIMEMAEWRRAADVFAIELADMQDAAVPLIGDHPAPPLPLDPSVLRLQGERELRSKLLHLHGGMLMLADRPGRLGELLVRALPSFVTYYRTALRLAGEPVPARMSQVIEAGCALTATDPAPLLRVASARQSGSAPEVRLTEPLADQFNSAAERLAAHIDTWGR